MLFLLCLYYKISQVRDTFFQPLCMYRVITFVCGFFFLFMLAFLLTLIFIQKSYNNFKYVNSGCFFSLLCLMILKIVVICLIHNWICRKTPSENLKLFSFRYFIGIYSNFNPLCKFYSCFVIYLSLKIS